MLNTFSTRRLHAVRMAASHEAMLAEMHADERVMATLGGARSADVNRQYVERNIAHWEEHGYGIWVFLNASGELVGRGGLLLYEFFEPGEVELNYSVAADHWRQGYATEMATASLQLGFEHLPLRSIISFTLATNGRSRKVMEKVGLTFEREFLHAEEPHALYRINRTAMPAQDAGVHASS